MFIPLNLEAHLDVLSQTYSQYTYKIKGKYGIYRISIL